MTSGTGDLVSTPSEMNPLETMMWRAEVDPRLRSPVIILDVLDTAPDWDRVVASHEWATRFVPRLRERVLEPWVTGARRPGCPTRTSRSRTISAATRWHAPADGVSSSTSRRRWP